MRLQKENARTVDSSDGPDNRSVVQQVFLGTQQIVSHAGVSQFQTSGNTGTGRSACGLAALNCARTVFQKEERGIRGERLLDEVLARETAEEITSICAYWNSPYHLDMEDIIQVPWFNKSLSLVQPPTYHPRCDFTSFMKLLQELKSVSSTASAAVMITRPPEIVACLKIPTSEADVFLIFDSHVRPNHPFGAAFILNTSMDATAVYLAALFKVDKHSSDRDIPRQFRWQVDLMSHFSGHILVSKQSDVDDQKNANQILLEPSMMILKLNAELAAMKSENSFLSSELEKSQNALSDLKKNMRTKVHERTKPPPKNAPSDPHRRGGDFIPPVWTRSPPTRSGQAMSRDGDNGDYLLALQLQWDINKEESASAERAAREQRRYDMEDRQLVSEREALAAALPGTFHCGICLDEHPEDSVARIVHCRHQFCRTCLREYIRNKLSEHIYPIFCPSCIAEQGTSEHTSVNEEIIRQLGFTEEEYRIFDELQISAHSILLHCRRCQQTMFVDRQEHQESKLLLCPLPGCQHIWCKSCQQTIKTFEPQHSCDGSSELNHLVKSSGWKYCPGCKTPIQKESGCNHMTCMVPNCNTHFCYKCGESIIKSALRGEIKSATSAHYQRCTLFDDVV